MQPSRRSLGSIIGSSTDLAAFEEASDELIFGHLEKNRGADCATMVGEPPVQCLRLGEIPREAIQDRSSAGVRLLETGEDELRHNVVRHQIAGLHDRVRRSTALVAKHVATRDVRQAERCAQ